MEPREVRGLLPQAPAEDRRQEAHGHTIEIPDDDADDAPDAPPDLMAVLKKALAAAK